MHRVETRRNPSVIDYPPLCEGGHISVETSLSIAGHASSNNTSADLTDAEKLVLWQGIRAGGWKAGLESLLVGLPVQKWAKLWLDCRQMGWKLLLDPRLRGTALVLDPDWGSVALSLACEFRQVHALLRDPLHLDCVQSRVSEAGCRNIKLTLVTNPSRMPFETASMDLVSLHLPDAAAETFWADPNGNLTPVLRECARVARPGGTIAVLLQNPWGFRRLAACLQGTTAASAPATTQYKIARFLRHAGLNLRVYPLDPGIRDPQRLFLPGHRLYPDVGPPVKRLLVRALNHRLLFDHFAPAIAILASQSDGKGSLVKEVLTAARVGLAARGLGDLDPFRVEKCLVTRPNGILLFLRAGRRKLILRIPLEGSVTLRRYQRNFWTLQALHTPEDPLGRVVPAGFLADSVAGQPFFVEEALPGEPGDARALAKTGDLSRALWEAVRFLTDLHRRSRQRGRLVGKWLEEAVHRPCRQLEAFVCSRMTLKQIRIIHDYLVKVLAGQILPRVWCHGDFKLDNLLFADGRTLTGVIDWDCSSEMGLPGLDLCHFIARKRSSLTGKTMVQALADGLGDRLPDPEDEDLYREYLAAVEVPPDLRFPLSVLCWVHQAGFRLDWPERVLFPSSIENMIGDYPRRVCQLLIQHG